MEQRLRACNLPGPLERIIAAYVGYAGKLDLNSFTSRVFSKVDPTNLATKAGKTFIQLHVSVKTSFEAVKGIKYDRARRVVAFYLEYTFHGRGYNALRAPKPVEMEYICFVPFEATKCVVEYAPQRRG